MRKTIKIANTLSFSQIENAQNNYNTVVFLNSNNKEGKSFLACGVKSKFTNKKGEFFDGLKQFVSEANDWIFGYFNYDLKNEVEPQLQSNNIDFTQLEPTHFFVPTVLIEIKKEGVFAHYHTKKELDEFLLALKKSNTKEYKQAPVEIKQRETKINYLEKIKQVKNHIQLGNIYEMNYCHQFYGDDIFINPYQKYMELNKLTKAPFSCYYKNKEEYILSASPERFLKKEGNLITSQPIKGTAKRGVTKEEDNQIKQELANNKKERSENIMIVDLVRNDLAKTAQKGSVKVEELCKVYTFDTVHQMISTITSKINKNTHPVDVIKACYPMGSMTGAPKIASMKLIEELEETRRGVYSGSIGYFTPNKDFDFNVVIRSILYNQTLNKLSLTVGGAITLKSNSEEEYKETLLKAEALLKCLK